MKYNMIFGHKTPDTDSVCSAIALAYLKNQLNEPSMAYTLGDINKETEFVLKYFKVDVPEILDNVRIQIKDLDYERVKPFKKHNSVHFAYFHMNENRLRTLPIVDDENKLCGLITMKDIAMSLINTDQHYLCTSFLFSGTVLFVLRIFQGRFFFSGTVLFFRDGSFRSQNFFSGTVLFVLRI
jgi:manganese-dependent inorganic pyrophosphatase